MNGTVKRLTIVAAVIAVGAGVSATTLPRAEATTIPHAAAIRWGECPELPPGAERDPRQECGTLQVPLDYRAPRKRTIEVAVSRIKAAKPEQRKGVMLMNGGGPGPSLDAPSEFAKHFPTEVLDRYDLVAFDPRGIGHSTPMECGRTADEMTRDLELGIFSFPGADGSIRRNVEYSRRMAKQCGERSGPLLPYLTSANVVRDMDQIRRSLGERVVSYYGISWGTYLGAVYRTLFPRTIDRMVLDSSVDPKLRGYEDFRTFAGAFEDRWPDLAAFGVRFRDEVRFGSTEAQVREAFLATAAQLDRAPVSLPGTKAPLNGNLLRLFTFLLSYQDQNLTATPEAPLPTMGLLWRAAGNFAAGRQTPEDGAVVEALANGLVAGGTMPGVPQDNLFSVGWAISCGDTAWTRDVRVYERNTAADRAAFPLTAGAPSNVAPCAFWPVKPVERDVDVRSLGLRNVLILQNRRDPATPLRTAQGMRRALGNDAVLVDVDAGGHGVAIHMNPNACAIGAMNTFFATGELPAGDRSCAAA
ncbi:hydrolase [Virgisporangium aliadipatigenens]|uniref:Hydrolase n=1 Tax=Virgisporangium aliadipatigenens TaxID=741659 RepID=A0A8J3YUU7_9ACTN|nr:alpha/beta hydrolase [Virgisporangium aliadipatigenens]GIJ50917.1 hydrolase [Virgisporangium aliadipatigenens]